jgi:hypothetical protein
MSTVLFFFLSLIIGYYISLTFSHPEKKKHLLPSIRFKSIELLPNVRIHRRDKTYWLHHWVYWSILFAALLFAYDSFTHMMFLKGAALGGVFQGLRYPDRFKFRHPRIQ